MSRRAVGSGAHLGHGLNLQDARHQRARREVAREEVVVDGDVLDADGVLARHVLNDAVDEEERETMREAVHDLVDVEDGRLREGSDGKLSARAHDRMRGLPAVLDMCRNGLHTMLVPSLDGSEPSIAGAGSGAAAHTTSERAERALRATWDFLAMNLAGLDESAATRASPRAPAAGAAQRATTLLDRRASMLVRIARNSSIRGLGAVLLLSGPTRSEKGPGWRLRRWLTTPQPCQAPASSLLLRQ